MSDRRYERQQTQRGSHALKGPLAGLKVIDASTVVAGGFASVLMADLGAEVIKVENPAGGDSNRQLTPFKDGASLYHKMNARNKKSVTLDLRQAKGQSLFKRMAAKADAVIENFRAGTMEKWNLGYDVLSADNPGLVMLRISGYGQDGPYSHRPGFGTIAEVMSGLTTRKGFADRHPLLSPIPLADEQTGMFGAYSIMAAIYRRDHDIGDAAGKGQVIDLALFEPLFRMIEDQVINYDQTGMVAERMGNRLLLNAPRGVFETRDGRWIAISAFTESTVKRLLNVVGGPALADDPRFVSPQLRVTNVDVLEDIICAWLKQHTEAEVLEIFDRADVVGCELYDIKKIMQDPHYLHRGDIVSVKDPELGDVKVCGVVPKFSDTPGEVAHLGIPLGQSNHEVYCDWLGVSEQEFEQLKSNGVL
ncbi:MAG: CoA transferase [Georgfuchsia sp.]